MPRDRVYIPGSHYLIDDKTGFKVRDFDTKDQWDGVVTRDESYEERHPQDYVRGTSEVDMKVPKARPRQVDVFLGPLQTETTTGAPAGGTVLAVFTELRFDVGDRVTVMLSSGENFATFVQDISTPGQLRVYPPLPYPVLPGAVLTNYGAVAGASIG